MPRSPPNWTASSSSRSTGQGGLGRRGGGVAGQCGLRVPRRPRRYLGSDVSRGGTRVITPGVAGVGPGDCVAKVPFDPRQSRMTKPMRAHLLRRLPRELAADPPAQMVVAARSDWTTVSINQKRRESRRRTLLVMVDQAAHQRWWSRIPAHRLTFLPELDYALCGVEVVLPQCQSTARAGTPSRRAGAGSADRDRGRCQCARPRRGSPPIRHQGERDGCWPAGGAWGHGRPGCPSRRGGRRRRRAGTRNVARRPGVQPRSDRPVSCGGRRHRPELARQAV